MSVEISEAEIVFHRVNLFLIEVHRGLSSTGNGDRIQRHRSEERRGGDRIDMMVLTVTWARRLAPEICLPDRRYPNL
jgi:hypothetical protein